MRFFVLSGILFSAPGLVFAQDSAYVPLIGFPGLTGENMTIGGYINALYLIAISVAAFLVVARLIIAGFKYMLTDIVTQKEEAKKDIWGALTGLLIVLGAVLILETINPQLRNLQVLNLDGVNTPRLVPGGQGIPFTSGDNFVAASRECDGANEQLFIETDDVTGVRSSVCRVIGTGQTSDPAVIGDVSFDQSLVYSASDAQQIIADINTANPGSISTTITAVSNDTPKLTEIENNISQCEQRGYTTYRLNSQIAADVTDVTIICVP